MKQLDRDMYSCLPQKTTIQSIPKLNLDFLSQDDVEHYIIMIKCIIG